jgi:hypothetical protein
MRNRKMRCGIGMQKNRKECGNNAEKKCRGVKGRKIPNEG